MRVELAPCWAFAQTYDGSGFWPVVCSLFCAVSCRPQAVHDDALIWIKCREPALNVILGHAGFPSG
jgi:hypothetical protein